MRKKRERFAEEEAKRLEEFGGGPMGRDEKN